MDNEVYLKGRLVKDIEVIEVGNDKKKCYYTLAVDREYQDKDGNKITDFIDLVAWNNVAINMGKAVNVGDKIEIKGKLETNTVPGEDGHNKKYTNIITDKFKVLQRSKNKEQEQKDYSFER